MFLGKKYNIDKLKNKKIAQVITKLTQLTNLLSVSIFVLYINSISNKYNYINKKHL